MKHKARQIAVRLFLSNVNGYEDEAYQFMEDCPRPDETYADDYFDGKPYRIWYRFELDTISKVMDMIDDLTNDIVRSFSPTDDNMPENTVPEPFPECPECHSINFIKKGRERGKQRFKCKDCGKHFYDQ